MIDTVNLLALCPMHQRSQMLAIGFSPTCGHTEQSCKHLARWKYNFPNSLSAPRITWSEAPDRRQWLSASVSLPKILFGSNVYPLQSDEDISRSLLALSEFVSDCSEVRFDALSAKVSRVDFCHDWQLTPNEVLDYLHTLGRASLPRMRRTLIDDETVQFSNKSHAVVLYDKFQEVISRFSKGFATNEEVSASCGVLRFENRFLKAKACRGLAEKLSLPGRQAKHLLTSSVAFTVMTERMTQLGLDRPIRAGDARLTRLHELYGVGARFFALAGFMAACDQYGGENLIALGMARASYYRKRRELQKAGVWLTSLSKRSLSPLCLVNDRQETSAA